MDLLAVQGTLKSLLQLQMSKALTFRNPFYPLMYLGNLSLLPGASFHILYKLYLSPLTPSFS